MTTPAPGRRGGGPDDPGAWLAGVAAGLRAAGLATELSQTVAGPDLTAVLCQPGSREVEVIIDADGYIELRWWADPAATPAGIAAAVISAISAVGAAAPPAAPDDQASGPAADS